MAEVRIQLPCSNVIVTYASGQERADSLRLAEARQQIAEGGGCPPWRELAQGDMEMAALEARNWLRAGQLAGLVDGSEAGELWRRIEDLRGFEREYRNRLRAAITGDITCLQTVLDRLDGKEPRREPPRG